MQKRKTVLSAVLASTLFVCAAAQADPLVKLQILGSKTQGSGYVSNLSGVHPGDTVYVEIVGQMAPVGTSNSNKGTITALTSGTDGIGALYMDLTASNSATFSSIALATALTSPAAVGDWTGGFSPSPGVASSGTVTGVHPQAGLGHWNAATSPDVIWIGQLTVGSVSSVVSGAWHSGGTGTFRINGGSSGSITNTSETSSDHFVSISPLNIAVPEPASLGVLGLGCLALLRRSRKPQA